MSDASESEFKPDYEEDVPLPEVEWLKDGAGNTEQSELTPTVNKTRRYSSSLTNTPSVPLNVRVSGFLENCSIFYTSP